MAESRRLALVGYGKMGRRLEQLAPQHNLEVVLHLDSRSNRDGAGIDAERFRQVDVAIEFTGPEMAGANLTRLAALKVPAVTGSTGWLEQLPRITTEIEQYGSGLVWSANFSTGVAIFRKLTGLAAELFAAEKDYGAWAWEIHHDAKKDAPSGTLLQLVEAMKKRGYMRPIDVASNRSGKHPGTHEIGFDSEADTVTLRHVARNRDGFAHGALRAANWIIGRTGVYTFEDVLFGPQSDANTIPDTK